MSGLFEGCLSPMLLDAGKCTHVFIGFLNLAWLTKVFRLNQTNFFFCRATNLNGLNSK